MKIKIGIAPIAWSNDDMPELGGDTPIEICSKLIDMGIITQEEIFQLEKEANLTINQATEKVEDEPFPSIDNMLLHSDLE